MTALAAREHAPVLTGSYDQGDPLTTNVHVSNLPMTINEQALGMMFAEYGPVGSVKVNSYLVPFVPFLVNER